MFVDNWNNSVSIFNNSSHGCDGGVFGGEGVGVFLSAFILSH